MANEAASAARDMRQSPEERTGPRYGVLGGTFDPPHLGHLLLAQEAYARLGLDRVWFVPTREAPHKQGRHTSPPQDRRAMVELAIAADARFALSDVELRREGLSYTAVTLRQLRAEWGKDVAISFLLGWDMLQSLPTWYDTAGLLEALDRLVAVHRPGFVVEPGVVERLEAWLPGLRAKLALLEMPQVEIAASELRERVATGLPIRYLTPEPVRAYIEEHNLYHDLTYMSSSAPDARDA